TQFPGLLETFRGMLVVLNRSGKFLLKALGITAIPVDVALLGMDPNGVIKVIDCLIELLFAAPGHPTADTEPRFTDIRPEPNCLVVIVDCLVEFLVQAQDRAAK